MTLVNTLLAICFCLLTASAPPPGQSPASATQGGSVMPGINDTWKSPNIGPLINTLETESREIYRERENLAALVGPLPGGVIADIGAGSGFMVELFAKQVGSSGKVYAVDINVRLLEHIVARAKRDGLHNIETVVAKEDSVELPPNSVDMIFICDTYHHFEYPQSTMRSIRRALRPGGQLIIVDFRRIPGVTPQRMLEHVRAGEEVFTKEIVEAGFELTNIHGAPFLKDNYILRFRKAEKGVTLRWTPPQASRKSLHLPA